MKFHTKVASFGINGGQSYVLSMLFVVAVVIVHFIYVPSRGVGGSHALHGDIVYPQMICSCGENDLLWRRVTISFLGFSSATAQILTIVNN